MHRTYHVLRRALSGQVVESAIQIYDTDHNGLDLWAVEIDGRYMTYHKVNFEIRDVMGFTLEAGCHADHDGVTRFAFMTSPDLDRAHQVTIRKDDQGLFVPWIGTMSLSPREHRDQAFAAAFWFVTGI